MESLEQIENSKLYTLSLNIAYPSHSTVELNLPLYGQLLEVSTPMME